MTRFHRTRTSAGIFAFASAMLIQACSTDSPPDSRSESSMIRVRNGTGLVLDSLVVGAEHFGPLDTSAQTEYRKWGVAYRYDYVHVFAPDTDLVLQPIDFVGETSLGEGFFTYHLSIRSGDFGRVLEIAATRDR